MDFLEEWYYEIAMGMSTQKKQKHNSNIVVQRKTPSAVLEHYIRNNENIYKIKCFCCNAWKRTMFCHGDSGCGCKKKAYSIMRRSNGCNKIEIIQTFNWNAGTDTSALEIIRSLVAYNINTNDRTWFDFIHVLIEFIEYILRKNKTITYFK